MIIETSTGNKYMYIPALNIIIPVSRSIPNSIIKKLSSATTVELLKSVLDEIERGQINLPSVESLIKLLNLYIKYYENLKNVTKNFNENDTITGEYIREYLLRQGYKQLTLEVTQRCNLRCKYCIYSEYYPTYRSHSTLDMPWSICKKAIDIYFGYLNEGSRYNPNRVPVIGFYGGEPLLKFGLIKQSVEYIRDKYSEWKETMFTITTNGTIINDKIIKFLVDNNFQIIVSLDGPKEIHDANRVFPNGRGSYEYVSKFLRKVREFGGEAYANATFTPTTNLMECDRFFSKNSDVVLLRMNPVSLEENSTYYQQFTENELKRLRDQIRLIRESYKKGLGQKQANMSVSAVMMVEEIFPLLFKLNSLPFPGAIIPYTGACVPGTKLYVNSKGDIHICEKVPPFYPIGHVDRGLDFEKIAEFLNLFRKNVLSKCRGCPIRHLCEFCHIHFLKEEGINKPNNLCGSLYSDLVDRIRITLELLEEYPDLESLLTSVRALKGVE